MLVLPTHRPQNRLLMHNYSHASVLCSPYLSLLMYGLLCFQLKNMKLVHWQGNSAVKRHLEPVPLDEYSVAMILADEKRENDMMHSDSHSLSSLLLIRDLQEKKRREKREALMHGNRILAQNLQNWNTSKELKCAVVCEILDSRTQETISRNEQVALSSDFVQSNKYISQILAMVSEDRNVKTILSQLLKPEGASLKVRSSRQYCNPEERLSFMQLQERAMRLDKLLIGYQQHTANGKTVINPKDKYKVKSWTGLGELGVWNYLSVSQVAVDFLHTLG